ncbi:MAG: ral secretion pathway protein GspK [Proteobacteria bacterium]|nr:ral secretion pathway protein GspK [Pseudomonadota bacterium]
MNSPTSLPGKQQGIAVVTAILIAAMVASLAFALTARERQWLNQMENRNDLSAAQAVAFAAVDLARLTLRDDMRNTQVDHLLETWTVPVPPINVDEGRVSGRLIELQGRFNLFNLQSGGKVSEANVVVLQRLLATRGLPTEWAGKMALAVAKQAALIQSSSTANKASKLLPLVNLAELSDLAGLDAGKLAALEPLLVMLPEATAVNVNFALPEVLMAVTPGLSSGEADQLLSRRASAYFKSVGDFTGALPERLRNTAVSSAYTVESQYFLSEAQSWFGRAQVRLQALLYRQRNKIPEIVWMRRG